MIDPVFNPEASIDPLHKFLNRKIDSNKLNYEKLQQSNKQPEKDMIAIASEPAPGWNFNATSSSIEEKDSANDFEDFSSDEIKNAFNRKWKN